MNDDHEVTVPNTRRMRYAQPPRRALVARPWRTFGAEVRHMTGVFALCVAPFAFVFGYIDGRAFAFAFCAALVLLLSTVQPKHRNTR